MRKLPMLKPKLQEIDLVKARGIKMVKTLKEKQQANGRTLALNGAAWRRLRAMILSDEPLCRHCYAHGRVNMATDVDHIDNDPSNNSRENLCGLCHECHSRKTAADRGYNVSMGCDASGTPLSTNHPWNVALKAGNSRQADSQEPTGKTCFNANRNDKP